MSSPQNSLDRELGAATDKLSLTSHQAAHAVLFTNELLCDIVARLPFRDIVSVTAVCKTWRGALKEDPHVQEALFLKPMEVREVLCDNHLLNDLERPISLDDCTVICKLHPFADKILGKVLVGKGSRFPSQPFPNIEHPDGTWREMFITQPPSTKLRVCDGRAMFNYDFPFVEVPRTTGVTFGEIYDFLKPKQPHLAQAFTVTIAVRGYADEDNMPRDRPFTSRCKVRDGEVCRPTGLPLPVARPDTDSSDDSDFTDEDDEDGNHGFDQRRCYAGGDFGQRGYSDEGGF